MGKLQRENWGGKKKKKREIVPVSHRYHLANIPAMGFNILAVM